MERRRFPRIEVNLPAVYRSAHRTMDTLVCNLSQGGVAIMGPDTDCVGTTGEISITLPGPGQLDFEGHIIWNETSVETPCMGFCFDDLPRDQRAALANFLLARFHRP